MYYFCHYNRSNNSVYIFDDELGVIEEEYKPYCYVVTNEPTKYINIYGQTVKKIAYDSTMKDDPHYFETDVDVELRTIVDKYYNNKEIAKNRIIYLDIETLSYGGIDTEKTPNMVTAMTIYYKGKNIVLVNDYYNKFSLQSTEDTAFIICKTEKELLSKFLGIYHKINPTIITNWNGHNFDMPYLYNRIKKILGKDRANSLSPIGVVETDFIITARNIEHVGIRIIGVNNLDYMLLYKKYCQNDKSSFKLDNVCLNELGKMKLEYTGKLDDLYKNDINKYIEYNIHDVRLIVELENKLHYISTAVNICHKGCITYDQVFMQSKIIEGAFFIYFKEHNIVSFNKPSKEKSEKYRGALVKDPVPGRHGWSFSCDLTSLYPSIIRTLNISPETKVGKILKIEKSGQVTFTYLNKKYTVSSEKFKEFLKKSKVRRSCVGVLYKNDVKGFIPSILGNWFSERKEFKRLKNEALKAGKFELANEYDTKQYITKILLNSTYGVLGLPSFRFYDKDNAESVTMTGQNIITTAQIKANALYKEITGKDEDYVIYGDTDSVAGSSMLITEYGDMSIDNYYKLLASGVLNLEISANGRYFVFPTNSKLNYYDEKEKCVKFGKVDYIEKHLVRKKMYRIKASNGKFIEVTEDHSLMVLENGVLVEKKPLDLKKTDKIIGIKRSAQLEYEILEIESIECLGHVDDYVYDIGMADNPHTFFANDILVHNSIYLKAKPLVEKLNLTNQQMLNYTRILAYNVTIMLNEELSRFSKEVLNSEENYLSFNQESICESGIWCKKKKYVIHRLDKEGYVFLKETNKLVQSGFTPIRVGTLQEIVDKKLYDIVYENEIKYEQIKKEMKITGIEVVKSDFPKAFREVLSWVIEDMLTMKTKEEINNKIKKFVMGLDECDISDLAIPKGVKGITKYYDSENRYIKGAPIHVKSAINYNILLDRYKLVNDYSKITDGEKLKYIPLRGNEFGFETIAFKDDAIPKELEHFFKKYIDSNSIFERQLLKKLTYFWEILNWGNFIINNEKASKYI